MKGRKLITGGLHKLILSTNKNGIRNGMYTGEKKLCSIYLIFTLRKKNQMRYELYSEIFQLFGEI